MKNECANGAILPTVMYRRTKQCLCLVRWHCNVLECGLIVWPQTSGLSTSPNGVVVDSHKILEIKCSASQTFDKHGRLQTLFTSGKCDAKYQDKRLVLSKTGKKKQVLFASSTATILLPQKAVWYFVVWSPTESHIIELCYDADYLNARIPKLEGIYFSHPPEMVCFKSTMYLPEFFPSCLWKPGNFGHRNFRPGNFRKHSLWVASMMWNIRTTGLFSKTRKEQVLASSTATTLLPEKAVWFRCVVTHWSPCHRVALRCRLPQCNNFQTDSIAFIFCSCSQP